MSQHSIKFGSSELVFRLSFKSRKTLGIKVLPDGSVEVVAPLEADIEEIYEKILRKGRWIKKQQAYFKSFLPHTPTRQYISGETHLYIGRQYKLQIIEDTQQKVKLRRGVMEVYTKKPNAESVKKLMYQFYKAQAVIIFEELWQKCKILDKRFEKSGELKIQQMKNRWGSCSQSGSIILNLELIKAPKACIEYVIIHELCHLVYHNHSKDFYCLLAQLYPDWERWKDKLERLMV